MAHIVPRVPGTAELEKSVEATREPSFLLAEPEKRLLRWIAARLPRWILPDDMTALGVLAALGVCVAYQLSNDSIEWLWAASGLLVAQWLGDSLDGTLARVRGIERPTYGYYLDHLVDAIAVPIDQALDRDAHVFLDESAHFEQARLEVLQFVLEMAGRPPDRLHQPNRPVT